ENDGELSHCTVNANGCVATNGPPTSGRTSFVISDMRQMRRLMVLPRHDAQVPGRAFHSCRVVTTRQTTFPSLENCKSYTSPEIGGRCAVPSAPRSHCGQQLLQPGPSCGTSPSIMPGSLGS